MSEDLESRVAALEKMVRNMQALARGPKGEDGRDGTNGRDGRDAKPITTQRLEAAVLAVIPLHKQPAVNVKVEIVDRPRKAVFNKAGEPVGTVGVDTLEEVTG